LWIGNELKHEPELTELATGFTVSDYLKARNKEGRGRIAEGIRLRFTERYIDPITGPKKNGFTMMAISCLMIEAVAGFQYGWPHTDGKSQRAFRRFFRDTVRFKRLRRGQDWVLCEHTLRNLASGGVYRRMENPSKRPAPRSRKEDDQRHSVCQTPNHDAERLLR
jgi:hypothetical protein